MVMCDAIALGGEYATLPNLNVLFLMKLFCNEYYRFLDRVNRPSYLIRQLIE